MKVELIFGGLKSIKYLFSFFARSEEISNMKLKISFMHLVAIQPLEAGISLQDINRKNKSTRARVAPGFFFGGGGLNRNFFKILRSDKKIFSRNNQSQIIMERYRSIL